MGVVQRELWKIYHKRTLRFITLIAPLLAFVLVAWIFSNNVPRDLPIAVVDDDHTALSRQIARMVDATSIAAVNRNFNDLEAARKAVENGSVEGVLYIPDETEKGILRGTSSKLALYINNANIVKGGLISSGVRKALSTMSVGIKLQMQMKTGKTQDQAMSRVMPVQLRQVMLFNPYTSYSYYLTAGLLPVMLVVVVLLGTTYAIGDELYRGTGPQWIRSAGGNFPLALAGKILPYTLIYFFWAQVMNLILFNYLGMPLRGNYHLILLGELLMIFSYQFFAIFMVAITSNLRLSLSLGTGYSMLGLTYSGLTFPIFGMSGFSQIAASIFPFTYWIKILISQSLRGEPATNGIMPMFSLWVFIIFGLMFVPRLRYMMLNRSRWGKI